VSPARLLAAAALLVVLGGCANDPEEPAAEPTPAPPAPTRTTASTESPPPPPPTPSKPARPTYDFDIRRLTPDEQAAMTGVSWRPGCPVPLQRLRVLRLSHWDFSGKVRRGALVVRADVAEEVAKIFGRLFRDRFPIRRITPVDAYEGDDYTSIEADNTSAFNCRAATGSSEWSHHAYGLAIDLNPLENPYVLDGSTSHPGSVTYLDRDRVRPGMVVEGDPVVRAFEAAGWYWGGDWTNPVDYQHFSKLPPP
jgi:D-alanyl-D-alanine carboxypeptidase-like protein